MRELENFVDGGLFDEAFNELFRPYDKKNMAMKTDVKEDEHQFELDIDMPGFNKNEINVDLHEGYLVVSAKKQQEHQEGNEKKGNFIRKERSFCASRSFYVGEKIKENDIKAKYENGVLNLIVPKEEQKKLPEHKIQID